MTSEQIQHTIAEIADRLSSIDAEELAASDSGAFDRIPSLRVEREQLAAELETLYAERAAALEAERAEQRDDLGPRIASEYKEFHARNVAAVEAFEAAAMALIESDTAQRKYVQWADSVLRSAGEGGPVRLGPVPAIVVGPVGKAVRIENESKYLATEIARITEPLWRAVGDGAQANAMNIRKRGGNRLAAL
jgi:hypothetical protein